MASSGKVLKGYVKTENMILFVIVGLAAGFLGGVVFSAYRTGGQVPVPAGNASGPIPITQQQTESIAALIKATEVTPDDVNAWTQLGHLYFDTDQHAKAIQAYEKSLDLDATRPDVWTDLGVMYRRNGDPQKAVQSFDQAIKLKKDHEIAMFNKGVVLMHDLKDPEGAMMAWEMLVQINPDAKTPNGQPVKQLLEQLKKNAAS